jgi:hypothetical protein
MLARISRYSRERENGRRVNKEITLISKQTEKKVTKQPRESIQSRVPRGIRDEQRHAGCFVSEPPRARPNGPRRVRRECTEACTLFGTLIRAVASRLSLQSRDFSRSLLRGDNRFIGASGLSLMESD